MELKKILGANVRHRRKARNLTQEALAEKAEISIEMMGRVERGEVSPSFETVESIAYALQIPAVALFGTASIENTEGERGKLLHRMTVALSRLNDDDLTRVTRMMEAYIGK